MCAKIEIKYCPNCGRDLSAFYINDSDNDELYDEVLKYVVEKKKASASLFQRKFNIGYVRSTKLLDKLEDNGVIGPSNGSSPREVKV